MTAANGTTAPAPAALAIRPQSAPLATHDQRTDPAAFEPGSAAEALAIAETLVKGRLVPESLQTKEAAFTVIMKGRELGLSVMQSINGIDVIKGKPVTKAKTLLGLVKKRRDICEYIQLLESTDAVATYETKRVGEPSAVKMSFTMDDALRAGLAGKGGQNEAMYKKYPREMLRNRAASFICNEVYPDITQGTADEHEIPREEPRAARDISPRAEVLPPTVRQPAQATASAATTAPAEPAESNEAPFSPAAKALVDEIADFRGEVKILDFAGKVVAAGQANEIDVHEIATVFVMMLDRCQKPKETNDAATAVVGLRAQLPEEVRKDLQAKYLIRKAALKKWEEEQAKGLDDGPATTGATREPGEEG